MNGNVNWLRIPKTNGWGDIFGFGGQFELPGYAVTPHELRSFTFPIWGWLFALACINGLIRRFFDTKIKGNFSQLAYKRVKSMPPFLFTARKTTPCRREGVVKQFYDPKKGAKKGSVYDHFALPFANRQCDFRSVPFH